MIGPRWSAGRTLLDLVDAPRPPADAAAPPRFLPMWDSALLAWDDRTRIPPRPTGPQSSPRTVTCCRPSWSTASSRLWWVEPDGAGTRIVLEPFGRLSRGANRALEAEAAALTAFYEPIEPRVFARYRRTRARREPPIGD